MFSKKITRYVDTISRTKTGLKVLIVDSLVIEQQVLLEIIQHYLPQSTAKAMNLHQLDEELNQDLVTYDLIILEERLLLNQEDRWCTRKLRKKYPRAKLALFIDLEKLHQLQAVPQRPTIDIFLMKRDTVETIAEKLCLTFQEGR